MKTIALLALVATLVSSAHAAPTASDEKSANSQVPNVISNPRDVQSYSATTVGGASWTRPFADGTCCSALGPVVLHQQTFTVSANDTCNVGSVQDDWDGFLLLYGGGFDPVNPIANYIAGNDDGGGIGTSDIGAVALTAGTTYHIVTTGFALGDEGAFTNTVTCPSALVTLAGTGTPPQPYSYVPVPSLGQTGLLLLGLMAAFAGVVTLRRRT